jgi:hypothetical protein
MDHKEQHHQHHLHEREEKKKERKEHEHEVEKKLLPIHPAWLLAVAVALILVSMLIWSMLP